MRLHARWLYVGLVVMLLPLFIFLVAGIAGGVLGIDPSFVIIITGVGLVFTIFNFLFISGFYKSVVKPIDQLNDATRKIAEGNLEFSIHAEGTDELSQLCNNFDEMRQRLKESTETKLKYDTENRELISNISHDLKTPITSIKGYVEGIMDGVADTPEKMDRYIKTIYNKTNEMDRLINELTLYSKIDTNRIPYNFHRINVSEFFNDCVEEIGMDLESKNIDLIYNNEITEDTRIIADPEQLRRVISNIIGNSVKYMDKPKGTIRITILDNNDSIEVDLEDDGRGIAAKDLPNIFERFYRSDKVRTSGSGYGLGLAICKEIIESHSGTIHAERSPSGGLSIISKLIISK